MAALLALCTCPTREYADQIAHACVEASAAACVNIFPKVTSIYRWKGTVQKEAEVQLFIKSTDDCFEQLKSIITELHPYDTPELIALPITQAFQPYLDWIEHSTNPA